MGDASVETIRLVGGHPAVDFVNTVDDRRNSQSPDALTDYVDAVRWAVRAGVLEPALESSLMRHAADTPGAASEALARLLVAREALYEVFLAEAEARAPAGDALRAVAELAAQASSHRTLVYADSKFIWGWDHHEVDSILHRVVFAAAQFLVAASERRPLGQCQGPNCGWLFLDTSRSGRRRWCSDESCGTTERVRRFRNKAARPQG